LGVTRAALALIVASTVAHADPMQVLVVKRAGVTAYEEVSEEFAERCRVRARVVSIGDDGTHPPLDLTANDLVVTVGQEALDMVQAQGRESKARIIPTLAFHVPEGLVGPAATPSPELLLKMLVTARPRIKTIGAVFGARSEATLRQAMHAAQKLGVTLTATRVTDGPAAVRALHALAPAVDALWLPGDADVVTPQVFQFALRLQLERGLPVAAATRQQVHSGALLAVDFSPRSAGRVAADLANRMLEGRTPGDPDLEIYGGARVTVNAAVARRLAVDVETLAKMGARIE
jgi:hypothetical protein